jgi:HlyD family secretion protein
LSVVQALKETTMANPKKRRKKIIILVVIALVLGVLALKAFSKKSDPVITVQTDKVTRRNLTETVVANGKIQPIVQVHISPEVSGEIIELAVKEGQQVKKGDLLLKIKPEFYIANLHQAEAGYQSSLAGKTTAEANLEKAEAEFKRNKELFDRNLISDSDFIGFKTARAIAAAQLESSTHQVEMAKASVASAQDSLDKTTIVSPLDGTVSKLNSQLGERVLGTAQNAGTDIMVVSDLNEMEARVDIGEMDVVLIQPGQKTRLEVDAFKNRKFAGTVTQIANSSKGSGMPGGGGGQSQDATKFEVRIRFGEIEAFRPGMSVSAEIETRYRTNALTVPLAAVTTRPPKTPEKKDKSSPVTAKSTDTNPPTPATPATNSTAADKKSKDKDAAKMVEVVFVVEGGQVKMAPVKIGICDDNYWEITDGLTEGQEIVSGGYRAISRDLDDGKKITKGKVADEEPKK